MTSRVQRWEARTEIPLLLLAVAFLVAYAWPVLDVRLDRSIETVLSVTSWTVWVVFAVDFVVRLALADDRRSYAARHWYDVALIALPMLRPLRLLRLLALARMLNRGFAGTLAGRVTSYVLGTSVAAVVISALAVLDAERDAADATITSFGDALWWAMTTLTTVGYGDLYPVTTTGRLVAVGLMLTGLVVLGTITASAASWFVANAPARKVEGSTGVGDRPVERS